MWGELKSLPCPPSIWRFITVFSPELPPDLEEETIRVSVLHALAYCPRLFYFEEVEGLRVADEAVYAGRRLHVELEKLEEGTWEELWLESESLGLRGRLDALRTRSGQVIPYEHKYEPISDSGGS